MKTNIILTTSIVLLLVLLSCSNNKTEAQAKNETNIKPFTASILNSFYAEAYSVKTVLTEKELKIILKSDLVGAKDTIVFSRLLQPSDTLRLISEININELKDHYENPCIDDGSQITVVIKKGNKIKNVHLSNYYEENIGKIIYLANSLVPEKYKIRYDKERLLAAYNRCK